MAPKENRTLAAGVAMLFETGRDFESASRYFLQAARSSAQVFAYPEAALLCERGLACLRLLAESPERDSRELQFSLVLGMALMSTRGYADPEVERTHRRSRDLCIKQNELRKLMPALWGIHTCEVNAARLSDALQTALKMKQVAEALQDRTALIEALHAHGTTLAFMGNLPQAKESLERILMMASVSQHEYRSSVYVLDPLVTSLSMLARVLALMGDVAAARERASESCRLARRLAHPPSLTYATFWVGWVLELIGLSAEARPELDTALSLAESHGLPLFAEWSRVVRGSGQVRMGHIAEGIAGIQLSLDRQLAMGSMLERPYCLTLLAEGLLARGSSVEALTICDQAYDLAVRTEGRSYLPETHRIRAEALCASTEDRRSEAQDEFRSAIEAAEDCGSSLLKLYAAVSFYRHRRAGDRDARRLLESCVERFENNLELPALTAARKLLAAQPE